MPRRRPGRGATLDPKLLPRVNAYLAGRDKKKRAYVDPDEVVLYLCSAFPEYKRKPQAVFKSNIERILARVLEQEQQPADGGSSENSDSNSDSDSAFELDSSGIQLMEVKDTNMLNSSLRRVYKEQGAAAASAEGGSAPSTPASTPSVVPMEDTPDYISVTPSTTTTTTTTTTATTDNTEILSDDKASSAAESNTRPRKRPRQLNPKEKDSRTPKKKAALSSRLTTTKKKKRPAGGALAKHFGQDDQPNEELGEGRLGMAPIPKTRYSDLGGVEEILQDVRELIEWPLTHSELYHHLGVEPTNGILLHGPPGCGKTLLASAIAGEMGVPFFKISAPEIVSGMSGESESKIRKLFGDAMAVAPSIVFIDEIDAITPRRDTTEREMSRRIVAQFLTCMDELANSSSETDGVVIVIGATNRPDSLDPAIRRAGRFAREIAMGIPDESARESILKVLSAKLRLEGGFDLRKIAHLTPGYVGADLAALTKEAANLAVHRIFHRIMTQAPPTPATPIDSSVVTTESTELTGGGEQMSIDSPPAVSDDNGEKEAPAKNAEDEMADSEDPILETPAERKRRLLLKRQKTSENLRGVQKLTEEQLAPLAITMEDFEEAIKKVQPSAKREGFATIPDVTWDDVGALRELREELSLCVLGPIRRPLVYQRMGLSAATGVLLYGPPGCGKTLLAKAIANEAGFNFISVKGPELLNKFVGESERAVRDVFQRGRASSPCIIFFDELDALCPRRDSDSTNNSSQRVVNQMLTEMDGLEARKSVYIIAATNRPDIIDPAIMRPGRLDKLLYVPLPAPEERIEILQTLTKKIPIDKSVDLHAVAEKCVRYSGADLTALVREASLIAVKEAMAHSPDLADPTDPSLCVRPSHFEIALSKIRPSVTPKQEKMYQSKALRFSTVAEKKDSNNGNDKENNNKAE